MSCDCPKPHYPLRFFEKMVLGVKVTLATRGKEPVALVLKEGYKEVIDVPEKRRDLLLKGYNDSHRFDWLHTPTYLDDKETHLRMKKETKR